MGLEGLESTNSLIRAASEFEKRTVLRSEIFRIAVNENHEKTLRQTAKDFPHFSSWMDTTTDDEQWQKLRTKEQGIIGALRLHGGCKVVHMASYLKGLWGACQATGDGKKQWIQDSSYSLTDYKWKERLVEFDCVVFAAGAGLFQASVVEQEFPIQTSSWTIDHNENWR